ncbi:MAG: glycosyltransferase [Gemmatimonadota bacterium]
MPDLGRPSISVLLPCRDAAEFLPECIASLESQSHSDFEVLAVDDGSRDDTASLLASWAQRDPRVLVLPGHSAGIVQALNLAAEHARAPLLARMDADDAAYPERLSRQAECLQNHPELAACGTGVEFFSGAAGPRAAAERDAGTPMGSGTLRYQSWINSIDSPDSVRRDLYVECPIAHPTLMIRRSVLAGLGGYRDRGWPEDYDLVLRLHAGGMSAANVPAVLHRWRVHPGRLSQRSPAYDAASFRSCKIHFLRSEALPPGRPVVVWGAGKVGKPFARELQRQGTTVAAFVDLDARKLGQSIHRATVLSPDQFASIDRPFTLGAVGSPGARDEIRQALTRLGHTECTDFLMVA